MHIIIEVEIKLLIDLQINDSDKYQYSEHLTVHFAKPISVDELKMPKERTGQQTEVKLRVWALPAGLLWAGISAFPGGAYSSLCSWTSDYFTILPTFSQTGN